MVHYDCVLFALSNSSEMLQWQVKNVSKFHYHPLKTSTHFTHVFSVTTETVCMVVCFSCEKVSNIGFVFVAFSPTNSGDVVMLFLSLDEMIEY